MKQYTRSKRLFDPAAKVPFRISRSKLEFFIDCPRCFYLDRRLGVGQPSMPAFTLNSAVDHLLKAEFDIYRAKAKTHPLMEQYGIDAIPLAHPMMDEWRENFKGVQHHHQKTNFIVFGAVDDIWVDREGRFYVVDYKSTSTSEKISLDGQYKQAYKRQMEIYQWLLRQEGFRVEDTGYFVYCNAQKNESMFDARLKFDMEIITYKGSDDWVDDVVIKAHECLTQNSLPEATEDCEFCQYRASAKLAESPTQPLPHKKAKLNNPAEDLFL